MSGEGIVVAQSASVVTVRSLVDDLRKLGLQRGQTILVHSSLRSLGWVCGGAQAVVQALLQAVGTEGTIMVPTNSSHLSDPKTWECPPVPQEWWQIIRDTMPAYDVNLTPTRDMGAIVDAFRHVPGALRSDHPQVSFSAVGPKAAQLTADHSLTAFLGEGSPLSKLCGLDGWVLLLGVDHDRNTSLHLAECRAQYSSKVMRTESAPIINANGEREWVSFDCGAMNDDDFLQIGSEFEKECTDAKVGKVGKATARFFPQRELIDFATSWMEKNRK